jgi:hypothetical protein
MSNSDSRISFDVNVSGSYVVLGEVKSVSLPEIVNTALDNTNYSSAGWKEKISSELKEIPPFTSVINFNTSASPLIADVINGTKKNYRIGYSNSTTWAFDGIVTRFKPMDSDASSPNVLRATLTIEPSGSPIIA